MRLAPSIIATLGLAGCIDPTEEIPAQNIGESREFPAKGIISGTDVEVYFGTYQASWVAEWRDVNRDGVAQPGELSHTRYGLSLHVPSTVSWYGILEWKWTGPDGEATGFDEVPAGAGSWDGELHVLMDGATGLSGVSVIVTAVLNPASG